MTWGNMPGEDALRLPRATDANGGVMSDSAAYVPSSAVARFLPGTPGPGASIRAGASDEADGSGRVDGS